MVKTGVCMPWGVFAPDEGTANRAYLGIRKGFEYLTGECGFDYIEMGVGDLLSLPEEDAEMLENDCKNGVFRIESTNCFICRGVHVTGPDASFDALEELAEDAYSRMSRFGVKISVFGSGKMRECPEGFSRSKAEQQFYDALVMMTKHAAKHGITVSLEPLRREETNMVNTVAQALEVVKSVGADNLGITADLYHMGQVQEPLEDLIAAKNYLRHMHAAEDDRSFVGNRNSAYLAESGKIMKSIGYDGRISCEAHFEHFREESKIAAKAMNELFK